MWLAWERRGSMIAGTEVIDLQQAFRANPLDLGVGLYNPSTGEMHVGSYDTIGDGQGHQGLADALGITNNGEWRGFMIFSRGQFLPTSHFNVVDGSSRMKQADEEVVRREFERTGLLF